MKTIVEKTELKPFSYAAFDEYFKGLRIGYFDLETTGLSPANSIIMTAGIMVPSTNAEELEFHQYFADSPEEEPLVIAKLMTDLDNLDVIVTYNGKQFDLPFLKERMRSCGLDELAKPMPYDLDLFPMIRYYSTVKQFLPDMHQKTIEKFLQLATDRDDELGGGELIELYKEYVWRPQSDIYNLISLHNSDDVKQLCRIMEILKKVDLHHALASLGYPFGELIIGKAKIYKSTHELKVSGLQVGEACEKAFYGCGSLQYTFSKSKRSFAIQIRLEYASGIHFADLSSLGLDLHKFAGMVELDGDYLVLEINGKNNYRAINRLVQTILEEITK